jgi:DNA-binding PucR family transcriptional regulator
LATVLASAPDISGRVVRHLLGRVADLAAAEQELLLGTLRTWMDCGGNTSATARELYCHRNTVRNRLQRVEELSGQSLSDPRGIAGLSLAAEGARLLRDRLTG